MLTERVAIRPEFFREGFIDDRDSPAARLSCFRGSKGAATKEWQADRGEISAPMLLKVELKARPSAAVAGLSSLFTCMPAR